MTSQWYLFNLIIPFCQAKILKKLFTKNSFNHTAVSISALSISIHSTVLKVRRATRPGKIGTLVLEAIIASPTKATLRHINQRDTAFFRK
jgi:glucose-6-phosphate-specific signal transduction histidine kinase